MMETYGTMHLTANELALAIATAKPGEPFIYATGDISYSTKPDAAELDLVRRMIWAAYHERGELLLTQRRLPELNFPERGGACFEYIAMKPREECVEFFKREAAIRCGRQRRQPKATESQSLPGVIHRDRPARSKGSVE